MDGTTNPDRHVEDSIHEKAVSLAFSFMDTSNTARTVVTDRPWAELHSSQLVPSAVDLAGDRLHVLFEGSWRAVDAQVAAFGGLDDDPWDDLRALQATLPGRVRWDGREAPLVRPGPGVAYVERAPVRNWSPLAERVREALCSPS